MKYSVTTLLLLAGAAHGQTTPPPDTTLLSGRMAYWQNITTNSTATISTDLPPGIYALYTGNTCLGKVVIE